MNVLFACGGGMMPALPNKDNAIDNRFGLQYDTFKNLNLRRIRNVDRHVLLWLNIMTTKCHIIYVLSYHLF